MSAYLKACCTKSIHLPGKTACLDPAWAEQANALRDYCQNDKIICPYCLEPVSFKAGEKISWHFAHKTLQNCPFSHDSPAVLELRSVLYNWLIAKSKGKPGWTVDVEIPLNNAAFERRIDCLVKTPKREFAYIIFDQGIKPENRDILENAARENAWYLNVIFAMKVSRANAYKPGQVFLTTTERHFIACKDYDYSPWSEEKFLGSLFYVDAKEQQVRVIRRILPFHPPQGFKGEILESKLKDALLHPKTGELVLPGEFEALQRSKDDFEELQRKEVAMQKAIDEQIALANKKSQDKQSFNLDKSKPWSNSNNNSQKLASQDPDDKSVPICVFCKKATNDWWSYDPTTNTCKCQNCSERNKKS